MTTDDAFLQDILANPEDDTPRSIYADWLDEQGDPRGEFLRLAVAWHEMSRDDARAPGCLARLQELRPYLSSGWVVAVCPWEDLWVVADVTGLWIS
jgi:uncharacterized protein (TIGR02996 family)